jgi:plasmid stabilization system protein ParE
VRSIRWSVTARAEYLEILKRIRADNPAAARRAANEIKRAMDLLALHNIGRRGRVEGTFEKSLVSLPYVIATQKPTARSASSYSGSSTTPAIGHPASGRGNPSARDRPSRAITIISKERRSWPSIAPQATSSLA